MKMKKTNLFLTAAATLASVPALAGGLLTNTNQSVSLLRQPAPNSVISVNGAYFNPAGVGFLEDGFQLSFGYQYARQEREVTSTFAPFAYNVNNPGSSAKTYKATTIVPILPTLDLSYNHDRFFGSFHFGVIGGGGKAPFEDGLGSFEGQFAMFPAIINAVAGEGTATGYSVDMGITGAQYYYSGQLNLGYRINDNLSVAAGLRGVYVNNSYNADITDFKLMTAAGLVPASAVISPLVGEERAAALTADRHLDCKQTDFTVVPVISVDYRTGKFNFAARYEFRAKVNLTNETASDAGLAQYADGGHMRGDIPAMLAMGVQYSIIPALRVQFDYNQYFDKSAKVYNSLTGADDKTSLLGHNPFEVNFGVEYDINRMFTVSTGVQNHIFDLGENDAYNSDMSFTTKSSTVGVGTRINLSDRLSFDVSVFKSFYRHNTKTMEDYNNIGASLARTLSSAGLPEAVISNLAASLKVPGTDTYYRNSLLLGVGVNYKF